MASKWFTAAPGIRCREHESRKHGIKPDRYFTVRYSAGGRQVEEALGWASEGWTLEKAKDKLAQLRDAKRDGKPATLRDIAEANQTASKAAKRKAEEEARRNVALATYWRESYEPWAAVAKPKALVRETSVWRLWIEPYVGALPIQGVGLEQFDHVVKTAAAAGLTEGSREYVAGTLRRIMKHARERRVVTEAPPTGKMCGATAAKNNRRQRVLDDDELLVFLGKLKDRDIHAWRVTLFAAGTGCRAGEAFALRWADIDMKTGSATFPKTKNGRARTVPLGSEILAMLADVPRGEPTSLVFPNSLGKPYTVAPTAFRKLAADMKLNEGRGPHDQFCFHSLRHMAATKLARVLPLRGLMDVLGWTQATMALRYSHTAEADRKTAAEALDAALRSAAIERKVVPMRRKRGEA